MTVRIDKIDNEFAKLKEGRFQNTLVLSIHILENLYFGPNETVWGFSMIFATLVKAQKCDP